MSSTSYTTTSVNIDTAEDISTNNITTDVAEGPTNYSNNVNDIAEYSSAENSTISSNYSFEILLLNSMKQATFEKQ